MSLGRDCAIASIFAQFNEMRQRKHRTDVTLVGCRRRRRRRIDAHRMVLEAASTYFRSIFRSTMDECQQGFVVVRILVDAF